MNLVKNKHKRGEKKAKQGNSLLDLSTDFVYKPIIYEEIVGRRKAKASRLIGRLSKDYTRVVVPA